MCVFLIRKMETLIFSWLENTGTFEIVHLMKNKKLPKKESAMKNLANVCT